MHSITVREMDLEVPAVEEFDPKWVVGNALMSYMTTGVSLYVGKLEPFLVKSLRRVLNRVDDPVLHEEVDRFCWQEAHHYKQHHRFNETIYSLGYPGLDALEGRIEHDFSRWQKDRGDKFCVGFVEGFEAYTTQSAIAALTSGMLDHPATDRRFGELFKWHLTEEIEHRFVAFDVYEHLYGDYLFRVKMCWTAQWHIWRFCMDCVRLMSAVDAERFDSSYAVPRKQRWLATAAILPVFVKTYLPGYTPHKLDVPESAAALSARYTELARTTR